MAGNNVKHEEQGIFRKLTPEERAAEDAILEYNARMAQLCGLEIHDPEESMRIALLHAVKLPLYN